MEIIIYCSGCGKETRHEDLGWAYGARRYQCVCGKRNEMPESDVTMVDVDPLRDGNNYECQNC